MRERVPSLVGLSLALFKEGLSVTLEATAAEIAELDAVQYLAGGPCVDSAREDAVVTFHSGDPTDESDWALFARASTSAGIGSTLTLPLTENDLVVGTVNLYAARVRAFEGHHRHVAAVFGAWAPGAVANADLDFDTRRVSQRAPATVREQLVLSRAVGLLVAKHDIAPDTARRRIEDAAERAGVTPADLARHVLDAEHPSTHYLE